MENQTIENIIKEQIVYYRARYDEYDEWFYRLNRYDRGYYFNRKWFQEVAIVKKALFQIGKFQNVL